MGSEANRGMTPEQCRLFISDTFVGNSGSMRVNSRVPVPVNYEQFLDEELSDFEGQSRESFDKYFAAVLNFSMPSAFGTQDQIDETAEKLIPLYKNMAKVLYVIFKENPDDEGLKVIYERLLKALKSHTVGKGPTLNYSSAQHRSGYKKPNRLTSIVSSFSFLRKDFECLFTRYGSGISDASDAVKAAVDGVCNFKN